MKICLCSIYGYVYDRELGDPENGIEPGTAFQNLREKWCCPVCGAEKEDFESE